MTKNAIIAAIDAQATESKVDGTMLRDGLSQLPSEHGFATIVTGVRRSGKSTLLQQWARKADEKCISVLFEDLRLLNFTTDDFLLLGKILAEQEAKAVILDEVQIIPGWERFVDGLLVQGYRVFVTCSNARTLSLELGTRLTGRHLDMHLKPFSYDEFIRFTDSPRSAESFREYLRLGGFPAYLHTRNRQVLTELFNDIIYRDIVARCGLTNSMPIRALAGCLFQQIGTKLSPSRLKDAIHVQSSKTVLDYFSYLTGCCLIERLECYAESPKARMLANKKVYACDTGLVGLFETTPDANLGHKLENIVFLRLNAKDGDLTYFETHAGECDFVRRGHDGIEAVQVCWEIDDDNREREFTGLLAAMERFDLAIGTIVTFNQSDEAVYKGRHIRIVPITEW